ncbi:succinoglycan biosynthesis protein ExoM [Humitalea rosea]|uniref:Succinoglycan biosynthesis protein ExoM n=1 Tax=Humitalea rosea TaxID=990373 RepID=A0A2W7I128_9PROT|nr:glycosyltransferase [Humitalea rosea]PZW40424.1 succinoglycan biosynthesis protein ExoM [Humitalea rosea]
MAPIVSVVICTYNRPALFARTLRICLDQATLTGLAHEIVVADNGPARHAQGIVDRMAATVPVRCIPCGPPNISIARNAGIAAARAPLIAFLDDDLEVAPGWLDALVAVMADDRVDAALGPVRPVFEDGRPPGWDPGASAFTRVLDLPTGTPIAAAGPLQPPGFVVSTASSIWRRATCFTDPAPFDVAYGASGGEDLDLFLRLQNRGRRFAWCAGAAVMETVLPHRTGFPFNRQRAYTFAQAYASATVGNAPHPLRTALRLRAIGLAQAVVHGGVAVLLSLAAWLLPAARPLAQRQALRAVAGWGKVAWHDRHGLYQSEAPGG